MPNPDKHCCTDCDNYRSSVTNTMAMLMGVVCAKNSGKKVYFNYQKGLLAIENDVFDLKEGLCPDWKQGLVQTITGDPTIDMTPR